MRETQKTKIERLEAENLTLKAELSALYEKYNALLANADNAAITSPAYQQLQRDLLVQSEAAKLYQRKFAACEKIRYQQAAEIEKFHKLIDEQNNKNSRHTGRKPRLTESQIQEILTFRKEGKTIRQIAQHFDCSIGLISKITKGEQ